MIRKLLFILLLCLLPTSALGAVTINLVGASNTQIVVSYLAPDSNICTWEVSESASYSPVVNDVDTAKFTNSNQDSRAGAITSGTIRIFVMGKRVVEVGTGGNYSRALQANTTHYYRVTCGAEIGTGSTATTNIPNGFSRGDTLTADPAGGGSILWPTLLSGSDRTASIIDPWTGALIKRVGLSGDRTGSSTVQGTSGGMHTFCNNNLSAQGFYRCALSTGGGEARGLYAIKPGTGEVRFLGLLSFFGQTYGFESGVKFCDTFGGGSWLWDQSDPNVYYCSLKDNGTPGKLVLAKVTLGGGTATDTAVAQNTDVTVASVSNLTPSPNDIIALFLSYDAAFDSTKFTCGPDAVQQTYAIYACRRGVQDSYAWAFVYNYGNGLPLGSGGNGSVIAGMKHWEQPTSRWCTWHTTLDAGHQPVLIVSNQNPKTDGVGTGRYLMTLQTNMPNNSDSMTISVTSTCPGGFPSCQTGDPVATNADEWLMGIAVNDFMKILTGGNIEYVKVTAKNSPTSLVIQRAIDGNSFTHNSGDTIEMMCNAQLFGSASQQTNPGATTEMNWAFLQTPKATDTAYYAVRWLGSSHTIYRDTFWVGDIFTVASGPITDPATWRQSNQYPTSFTPPFSGVSPVENPDRFETHPSYMNGFATGIEKLWALDANPFIGIIANTVTAVSGSLYKYTLNEPGGFNRRHVPTFAFSGSSILLDISGPSSSILDTAGDNYKYCIALAAGECRAGSLAGDVFVNIPGSVTLSCPAYPPVVTDVCLNDKGMRGLSVEQALIQIGASSSDSVKYQRVLTRLFTDPRIWPNTTNARSLPDGSWIVYTPATPALAVMIEVPPQPVPEVGDRTAFIPATLDASCPSGVTCDNAIVWFGYHEEGTPTNYYCTSRAETCAAYQNGVNTTTPFKWTTTESITGLSCGTSCQPTLPVIPSRVVYWTIKYRNASSITATGDRGVCIENKCVSINNPDPTTWRRGRL